jgi:hypothetical protein
MKVLWGFQGLDSLHTWSALVGPELEVKSTKFHLDDFHNPLS